MGLADITEQDLKEHMDSLRVYMDKRFDHVGKRFDHVDKRFDHVDKRFDHVDSELVAIKSKVNELIDATGEGGLQGKKVLKFPDTPVDAEEM
jgi:tetrahydromethanopterin S-methyltransferase subunit G